MIGPNLPLATTTTPRHSFAEPSYAALLARDYQMYTEITADSGLRDWLGTTQP